jgi:hypothetical protein
LCQDLFLKASLFPSIYSGGHPNIQDGIEPLVVNPDYTVLFRLFKNKKIPFIFEITPESPIIVRHMTDKKIKQRDSLHIALKPEGSGLEIWSLKHDRFVGLQFHLFWDEDIIKVIVGIAFFLVPCHLGLALMRVNTCGVSPVRIL